MPIDRLSAEDRLLLLSDRVWPQDVGVVLILDGGRLLDGSGHLRIEMAREAVAQGLPDLPRLRQVLRVQRRGLGGPFWADASSFDVAYHVREGPHIESGGEADLLRAVENVRSHRLDPAHPLWEIWLFPGLDAGRVGMFVRMHHVVADGVAGVASLAALLRTRSVDRVAQLAWIPAEEPSPRELLSDSLRRRANAIGAGISAIRRPSAVLQSAADVWRATRELVSGEPGPVTSLGGLVGPHRRLALVRASLAEVEEVAHETGATVNDVLLAMITGGVRALLINRGEPVDQLSLSILVPVSLRQGTDDAPLGNRISQMRVPLPVGDPNPRERLRRISAATARAKAMTHPSMGAVFRNRVLSGIVLRLVIRQRINLLSADIVGPTQPLSFAGATIHEAFPLINLLGNVTLGVGALSYAGRFDVLAVADADLHPDLDVFAAAAEAEVRVLGALCGTGA
ncbi:MAG TPA: wax ester/triacylglycerol synthase domain-containing protein [Lapillicoccus sp.]|nr:wax ester/triacylglycerol synthase domain-containing protein [Lapillicoccus sp.]